MTNHEDHNHPADCAPERRRLRGPVLYGVLRGQTRYLLWGPRSIIEGRGRKGGATRKGASPAP